MKFPKELRDTIDNATEPQLRVMVEHLVERAAIRGVAVMDQVEFFRELLELLRGGRITEAIELAERIVVASDEARAGEALAGPLDLNSLLPAGRA